MSDLCDRFFFRGNRKKFYKKSRDEICISKSRAKEMLDEFIKINGVMKLEPGEAKFNKIRFMSGHTIARSRARGSNGSYKK